MEYFYHLRVYTFSSLQGKNMFAIAVLLGIYSYGIFAIGLLGLLYKNVILVWSLVLFLISLFYFKKNSSICLSEYDSKILWRLILVVFVIQIIINFIGALGPEIAFDALWYHLTLPKLYLLKHSIDYIPGGLFYYSTMPKLLEMFFVPGLAFGGEFAAKLIHFFFGILTCAALYRFSKNKFGRETALITVVVFYSNLVVGWESITAYIDLGRTFFEFMALWAFFEWIENKKDALLIKSSIMLGLAISSKAIALTSLFIFSFLILYFLWKENKSLFISLKYLLKFIFLTLLIPLPWFLFSFLSTGNPIYPFFSKYYEILSSANILNPILFIKSIWNLFMFSSDPISPVYIISIPLLFLLPKKIKTQTIILFYYCGLAVIFWAVIPHTGGARFILPYLPAFSMLIGVIIRDILDKRIKKNFIIFIVVVTIINATYRGAANIKYIPYLLGYESKGEFLTKHLILCMVIFMILIIFSKRT